VTWLSHEEPVSTANEPRTKVERLGEVAAPSGDIVLIDFGLLHLWSNDDEPVLAPGLAPDRTTRIANSSVDVVVTGPDALELTSRVDLASGRGRYYFDQPPAFAADLRRQLEQTASKEQLRAEMAVLEHRVPHATRLHQLLAERPEGTEVPFHGMWAVAVRGVPADRALPVLGQRMDPNGPDAGRWWSVWVECDQGEVARSEPAGYVLVDEARLMWADPRALGNVRVDAGANDLFDVMFWGADAAGIADALGAEPGNESGSPIFGWRDVPRDQAKRRVAELERRKGDDHAGFAMEVRPHTDVWLLLGQARESHTGSGTVTVGPDKVCGYFTSWGDGAFPVYRDLDTTGRLLRVRVELGAAEIVERTRKFEERWFGPFAQLAIVSARVTRDQRPVAWLYREAPDRPDDSGWRVFAGDESEAYTDDPMNATVVPLRDLLEDDHALEPVLRTPAPCRFERSPDGLFRAV
jgi:hypothetical protein